MVPQLGAAGIATSSPFCQRGRSCQSSVSPHSLYAWKKRFARKASGDTRKDAEIGLLKRDLARVTEERDIQKKATAYFARDAK